MMRWALIIQNSIFIFTQTGSEKVWLTDKQWCTKDKGIVIYRRGHAFCCEMPPCWAKRGKKKNASHKLASDGNGGFIKTFDREGWLIHILTQSKHWILWLQWKHTAIKIIPPFGPSCVHLPQTPWILLIIDLSSPCSSRQHMRHEGSRGFFIYLKLKHVLTSFVLNGCWYDCIPTDLIIKGERHSEHER